MELLEVIRFRDPDRIRTRHESGPGHSANRLGIEVRELQPLRRHPVEMWCLNRL